MLPDPGQGETLKVPSQLYAGTLSPSKHGFLPSLSEIGNERSRRINKFKEMGGLREKDAEKETGESVQVKQEKFGVKKYREKDILLILFEHERLQRVQWDFERSDGYLDLEAFLVSVLSNFELYNPGTDSETEPKAEDNAIAVIKEGVTDDSDYEDPQQPEGEAKEGDTLAPQSSAKEEDTEFPPDLLYKAASIIELFQEIDVHNSDTITWEDTSTYLLEHGKIHSQEGDGRQVDTKSYESSNVVDSSKHENSVERLVYVEHIDAIVCFNNTKTFRIYDPKKLTLRHEVSGHRGSAINCCYIDSLDQLATCAADMTICLWDAVTFKLRSRIVCKDVQLCIAYSSSADPTYLYSGSIDGTITKWDLAKLSLHEARKAHKNEVNDLLMLHDMSLLGSASSDGTIILWDLQTFRAKKNLRGHKKGVLQLAYSLGCLLSVGLDQEALVWNPCVDTSFLFKLKGHAHSLCGVQNVASSNYPQILTGDCSGVFRLWDMRNFALAQVFGGQESYSDLTTFCAIPHLKRVAAGLGNIRLYDCVDAHEGDSLNIADSDETATDGRGVSGVAWDPHRGLFFTSSKRSVKVWDAETGTICKVLKEVAPADITALCLSENGRKLLMASGGKICSYGLGGKCLKEFSLPYNEDVTAIIRYKDGTILPKIITGSCRGQVKIHTDDGSSLPNCKAEFQAHTDSILCLSVCPDYLVSVGNDGKLVIYDLKIYKVDHVLEGFTDYVTTCDFFLHTSMDADMRHGSMVAAGKSEVKNVISLFCGDASGTISIFQKTEHMWKRVYAFDQSELIPFWKDVVDTASVKVLFRNGQVRIYVADIKGQLRCWDVTFLFRTKEQNLEILRQAQEETHGVAEKPAKKELKSQDSTFLTQTAAETAPKNGATGSGGNGNGSTPPERDGAKKQQQSVSHPVLLYERKAHSDAIVSCEIITYTCEDEDGNPAEDQALMTVALDKKVAITSCEDLRPLGVLCQNTNDISTLNPNRVVLSGVAEAQEDKRKGTEMRNPPWTFAFAARTLDYEKTILLLHKLKKKLEKAVARKAQYEKLPEARHASKLSPSTSPSKIKALEDLKQHKKGQSQTPLWKKTADAFAELDDLESCDFEILCEQMANSFESEIASKQNKQTTHQRGRLMRNKPLSKSEATAAERLAIALDSIGADEEGVYRQMAKSLDPASRHVPSM